MGNGECWIDVAVVEKSNHTGRVEYGKSFSWIRLPLFRMIGVQMHSNVVPCETSNWCECTPFTTKAHAEFADCTRDAGTRFDIMGFLVLTQRMVLVNDLQRCGFTHSILKFVFVIPIHSLALIQWGRRARLVYVIRLHHRTGKFCTTRTIHRTFAHRALHP